MPKGTKLCVDRVVPRVVVTHQVHHPRVVLITDGITDKIHIEQTDKMKGLDLHKTVEKEVDDHDC